MRLDKLALTAQEAFQSAMSIAGEREASAVEPIHLLDAILSAGEHNMNAIITRIGADPAVRFYGYGYYCSFSAICVTY